MKILNAKIRILHLEDVESDSTLVDRALKKGKIDFIKSWAKSKSEFISALDTFSPDIVLSDHSLPDIDSSEALQIFKQYKKTIPFVLVTGNVSEEYAVEILKNGADDYILKNNLDRLPSTIRLAIGAKTAMLEKANAINEIKRREELFAAMAQNNKDLTTLIDKNGVIKFQSPSVYNIMGYSETELLNQSVFNFIHPDDMNYARERLSAQVNNTAEGKHIEIRFRHKSGEWRVIESIGTNLLQNPFVNAIIINSRDISERKQLETRLKDKINELDTFIYKASHDLRAPLASMFGLIQIAKWELLDEKSQGYFDKLNECNQKMDKILTDLMEVVRISHEGLKKLDLIDFKDIISEILDSLEHLKNYSGIKFSVNVMTQRPFFSDSKLIRSILQNLIHNAINYRKQVLDSFVQISVLDKDDQLVVTVNDNGLGIPDNQTQKVYDMFFRGNYNSKGTGLGLYIVKRAVEKLGGTISLHTNEGEGTKFIVSFPFVEQNP